MITSEKSQWFTDDKIGSLEIKMHHLISYLAHLRDRPDTQTYKRVEYLEKAQERIQRLHSDLAGWELLIQAELLKDRERGA